MGDEREAIAWLQKDRGVAKDLPVRDYRPKAGWGGFKLTSLAADVADLVGLSPLAETLRYTDRPPVDGLVSIWQLSGGN